MGIKKALLKLDEITAILEKIKKHPIPESIVSMKKQRAMRERIKNVFSLCDNAIENKKKNIPRIHKELKEIISTLEKWVKLEEKCGGADFDFVIVDAQFKGYL